MKFGNSSPNRLGAAFIRDLDSDFRVNGAAAIARLRRDELRNYLKLVMALVPRQFDLENPLFSNVSTPELAEMVRLLKEHVAEEAAKKAQTEAVNG